MLLLASSRWIYFFNQIGQFDDDRHGSRLRTLVSHFPPAQVCLSCLQFDAWVRFGSIVRFALQSVSWVVIVKVLYEKGKLSEKTRALFNSNLSSAIRDGIRGGTEFWDSSKTLKFLAESDYFVDESTKDGGFKWPECLKQMIDDGGILHLLSASTHTIFLLLTSSLAQIVC